MNEELSKIARTMYVFGDPLVVLLIATATTTATRMPIPIAISHRPSLTAYPRSTPSAGNGRSTAARNRRTAPTRPAVARSRRPGSGAGTPS